MNEKIENRLVLALETAEETREKTENLNVGFNTEEESWELIVKYDTPPASFLQLMTETPGVLTAELLLSNYAILTVRQSQVDRVVSLPMIIYAEKPGLLYFAQYAVTDGSCIFPMAEGMEELTGRGVLVAVIDSGIDYRSPFFRKADGTTRIRYLWDQSDRSGQPPEGFYEGTEYSGQTIDAALRGEESVNSVDLSGHGTAVAGIAAGSPYGGYRGVAPEAELLIVRLGIGRQYGFPKTTELMRALTYVVKKSRLLEMPCAVNLSFGNCYGDHLGNSLLEQFLNEVQNFGRLCVCVGAGNEADTGGHAGGVLVNGEATTKLEVSLYEGALNVQLWKNYADHFEMEITSPVGEKLIFRDRPARTIKKAFRDSYVLIRVGEPSPYTPTQEIYMEIYPVNAYIESGQWTFGIRGERVVTGAYDFFLPSFAARGTATFFAEASRERTLTIPGTAEKVLTVGAYDLKYDTVAFFSGCGGECIPQKPDIVAPGVDIKAPVPGGGFGFFSGTSFAVPIVTGAAALLMDWGITGGRDPFMYGEKLKAFLQNEARPLNGESRYPNRRTGYGALCLKGLK